MSKNIACGAIAATPVFPQTAPGRGQHGLSKLVLASMPSLTKDATSQCQVTPLSPSPEQLYMQVGYPLPSLITHREIRLNTNSWFFLSLSCLY